MLSRKKRTNFLPPKWPPSVVNLTLSESFTWLLFRQIKIDRCVVCLQEETHSFQSRTCESPCPPPGSPGPRVQKRWVRDRKSSWERKGDGWESRDIRAEKHKSWESLRERPKKELRRMLLEHYINSPTAFHFTRAVVLTCRPRNLHCWSLQSAALLSWWSPVYELQREQQREETDRW